MNLMKHYIVLYVEETCFIYFVHLLTRLLAKAHGWEAQWLAPSAKVSLGFRSAERPRLLHVHPVLVSVFSGYSDFLSQKTCIL